MAVSNSISITKAIEHERLQKFLGTANVKLHLLDFPFSENEKRKDLLELRFQQQGHRSSKDLRHRLNATISHDDLNTALRLSGISKADLSANSLGNKDLDLPPGSRLNCLYGKAIIKAAKAVFEENDRWLVDLYLPGLSLELRTSLTEKSDYDTEPDDGEIFCRIREHQGVFGKRNTYLENEWWARLTEKSPSRKERFKQLFDHEGYLALFTRLLKAGLEGLFGGFRASVMHELIPSGCDVEAASYIDHIIKFFSDLFDGRVEMMRRLDRSSVEYLQGKAPGAFSADAQDVIGKIKTSKILAAYSDEERDTMWQRIFSLTKERSIPSLYTLFEDIKFLKPAGSLIKQLLPPGQAITTNLRTHMRKEKDQELNKCFIQSTESTYLEVTGDVNTQLELACRQLWIMAMRAYCPPTLNKTRSISEEAILFRLAAFAHKLGFESKEIETLLEESPDRRVATQMLNSVRDPHFYQYENFDECVDIIEEVISRAHEKPEPDDSQVMQAKRRRTQPYRWGKPQSLDHRSHLFLDRLHKPFRGKGDTITVDFVLRSIYFAFFGELESSFSETGQVFKCPLLPHSNARFRQGSDARQDTSESERLEERLARLNELVAERQINLQILTETIKNQESRLDNLTRAEKTSEKRLELLSYDIDTRRGKLFELDRIVAGRMKRSEALSEQRHGEHEITTRETQHTGVSTASDEPLHYGSLHDMATPTGVTSSGFSSSEPNRRDFSSSSEVDNPPTTRDNRLSRSSNNGAENTKTKDHEESQQKNMFREFHLRRRVSDRINDLSLDQASHSRRNEKQRITQLHFDQDADLTSDTQSLSSQTEVESPGRESENSEAFCIEFKTRTTDGNWAVADVLLVRPSETSNVEDVATNLERKGYYLFDTDGHRLRPRTLLDAVLEKDRTVWMIPVPPLLPDSRS